MSHRGHRGGGPPHSRGGGPHRGSSSRGGHAGSAQGGERERPKKENILDLGKYLDKRVGVKFNGGREGEFAFRLLEGGKEGLGGFRSEREIQR